MAIQRKPEVSAPAEEVSAVLEQVAEPTPEVTAPVAQAPEQTQTTAVATAAPTAVVAAPPQQAGGMKILNDLSNEGFSGLEINFTSFPIIILEKSAFTVNQSEAKVNEDFVVRIMSTREKFMFASQHPVADDREVAYSYDQHGDKNDAEIMAKIQAWKDNDGVGYVCKKYIEALAVMVDDKRNGELNDQMVLLQIPPTSVGKLSGYTVQQRLKNRGAPSDFLTQVGVGAKIGEGQTAFYPWTFKEHVEG